MTDAVRDAALSIVRSAADVAIEDAEIDTMIAKWLVAVGRFLLVDVTGPIFTVAPGWCRTAAAAERLFGQVLPEWHIDSRESLVTLIPDQATTARLGAQQIRICGIGPTLARSIIVATFSGLLLLQWIPGVVMEMADV